MPSLERHATLDASSLEKEELEVSTITLYQRDAALFRGTIIAVNSEYICYAIKGGMIRVINRVDAQRALLRGFSKHVSDMAFAPTEEAAEEDEEEAEESVLAAVGNDGNLYVWSLSSTDGTLEPCTLLHAEAGAPTPPGCAATDRVAWQPHGGGGEERRVLASVLSAGASVCLWAIHPSQPAQPPATLQLSLGAALPAAPAERAVRHLAFTPDGAALALALGSEVRIVDLRGLSAGGIASGAAHAALGPAVRVLAAIDGPVDTVAPVAPGVLLTGARGNTRLGLWQQAGDGGGYSLASELRVAPSAGGGAEQPDGLAYHMLCTPAPPPSDDDGADGGGGGAAAEPVIVLAAREAGEVLAVRLRTAAPGGAAFCAAAAYHTALPVLAMVARVEGGDAELGADGADGGGADGGGEEEEGAPAVALYAVQTTAVQRLALTAELLPPEGSAPAPGAGGAEAALAAQQARTGMPAGVPPRLAASLKQGGGGGGGGGGLPDDARSTAATAGDNGSEGGEMSDFPAETEGDEADDEAEGADASAAAAAAGAGGGGRPSGVLGPEGSASCAPAKPPSSAPSPFLQAALERLAGGGAAPTVPPGAGPTSAAEGGAAGPGQLRVLKRPDSADGGGGSSAPSATSATPPPGPQPPQQPQQPQPAAAAAAAAEQHRVQMAALQQLLNASKRAETAQLAAIERVRADASADLAACERRLEAVLAARVEQSGAALGAALGEQLRELAPATAGAVRAALAAELPQLLAPTVQRAARDAAVGAAPAVAAAVRDALAPQLAESARANAAAAAAAAPPAPPAATAAEIASPLVAACREQFARVLVPAVEAAVGVAAEQLRGAVDAHAASLHARTSADVREACAAQVSAAVAPLSELLSGGVAGAVQAALRPELDAALASALPPIAAHISTLRAAVDALPATLATAVGGAGRGAGGGAGADAAAAAAAAAGAGAAAPSGGSAQHEVDALVGSGYLEKAFATALSASDSALLGRLCAAVPPNALIESTDFGASTTQSKQIVLISLLQQLGEQLAAGARGPSGARVGGARWPSLQLDWLSEALLALTPAEPVIAGSVAQVLGVVTHGLEAAKGVGGLPDEGAVRRQMQIALHLVRSCNATA